MNPATGLARAAGANHWISRRIESILPPAGPLRRYAEIGLIDSTGTGLFAAVSTLFFTLVTGLPVGQVGLGLSLAGLAALLGAIPLGSLGDRLGHRRVWITVTLAYACSALAIAALAAGCVLLTIGELLQSAGAWGISYALARPERQGEYLGAFSMGTRLYDTVGPVLAVGLVLKFGVVGWVLMGALLLGISLALTPAVRATARAVRGPAQPGGHEPG